MKISEELIKKALEEEVDEKIAAIRQSMTYYKCALMEVETKFRVLNEQFSLYYDRNPIEAINTRMKSEVSIIRKLKRRNLPLTLDSMEQNIFDIAGVRIIGSFLEDIYLLANYFLQQDDVRLIEMKDYIKNPKPNGYRSLHLLIEIPIFLANEKKWIKVEVQFRTIAMDFWASLEHKLRYKKELSEQRLEEINQELFECAKICATLDKKMQSIKDSGEKHKQAAPNNPLSSFKVDFLTFTNGFTTS